MYQQISGRTKLFALIGSPVAHSLSPAMHNYSFRKTGYDGVYVAFDIKEEELSGAVDALRVFRMGGCNVTMPHKIRIIPYLDGLSPAADMIGAVNTVVNEEGRLIGHNTDGEGFVLNLADHGVSVSGKRIAVAGAGGAATAICVQCALSGAEQITILQRKYGSDGISAFWERAMQTAGRIRAGAAMCSVSTGDLTDTETLAEVVKNSDILINATNVGMKPMEDQSIIPDPRMFRPDLAVADVVYNPVETRLLREAKAAGCTTVDGRGMLLWQGAAAFRLFTGLEMPAEEVKQLFFAG